MLFNSITTYTLLTFSALSPTLSSPIASEAHPLEKRFAECRARMGGLKYAECNAAYQQIALDSMSFDPARANNLAGLPLIWSVGECTISASLIDINQPEQINYGHIITAAEEILEDCVGVYRWGGQAITGARRNFKVIFYQFSYEDDSDDGLGPDSVGTCSIKGGTAANRDVGSCVLNSAINSGFIGSSP